jgi:predicted nucleic acid-binding protein
MAPPGRKRQLYEDWLTKDIRGNYAQNFLPVDDRIADLAGKLIAHGKLAGAEPEPADALIAATARVHGLKVATLNRKHFERLGVELVDF